MMRNVLFTTIALLTVLLTGSCTNFPDEYGCEAELSMELISITSAGKDNYDAQFLLKANIRNLGGADMLEAGYRNRKDYGSGVPVAQIKNNGSGEYLIDIPGLSFYREYDFVPYLATENYRYEGTTMLQDSTQGPLYVNAEDMLSMELAAPVWNSQNSVTLGLKFNNAEFQQMMFRYAGIELSQNKWFDYPTYFDSSEKKADYAFTFSGLYSGETYYYRGFYTRSDRQENGKPVRIYTDIETLTIGSMDASHAVDLGLSVKWADQNYGASDNGPFGELVQWSPASTFNGLQQTSISGTNADWATRFWGDTWRMPSRSEMQELIDRCTWTQETQNGSKGWKVTGPNGKSIFLPAAGYSESGSINWRGTALRYWTGDDHDAYHAYYLHLNEGDQESPRITYGAGENPSTYKNYCFSVRPIR